MDSFLRKLVFWAVGLACVYGGLRATCLRVWTFPSDDRLLAASVAPTLEAGDVVVLWRLGAPSFGDVVRCPDPEAAGRFVVARLLGEAGSQVEVQASSIAVNGKRITFERSCSPKTVKVADPDSGEPVELWCDLEQIGRSEYSRLRSLAAERGLPAAARVAVPPASVYLISDNRHFHDDSRDFGPLPAEACSERVLLRLWSARGWFDSARRFTFIR